MSLLFLKSDLRWLGHAIVNTIVQRLGPAYFLRPAEFSSSVSVRVPCSLCVGASVSVSEAPAM